MEDVFIKLGFGSAEAGVGTLFILVIILFVICIALIIGVITLLIRKKDFSRNISGRSRASISGSGRSGSKVTPDDVRMVVQNQRDLTKNIDDIYRKLAASYRKTGIVKYNAYSNMSGNVSFVVAMLDGNDSGFILNVINGREGSNIYVKNVIDGDTKERLGEEEAQALQLALSD